MQYMPGNLTRCAAPNYPPPPPPHSPAEWAGARAASAHPAHDLDSGLLTIFTYLVHSHVFYRQSGMTDAGSEISDLTSMGFSVEVARHALMRCVPLAFLHCIFVTI
jgi:hypothetical protein